MFYSLVKGIVWLALQIFCRKITVHHAELLKAEGPLLLVANHPNSFLDAIIIGTFFKRPIHYLARGDVFNKPMHARLLRLLHMIPVYRMSEGRKNIFLNKSAFEQSKEILSKNGIVLIFIEGICVHKHALQPFKKGAARIALENATKKDFAVLPVTIAYDSFVHIGKQVNMVIEEKVSTEKLFPFAATAKNILFFNQYLFKTLQDKIVVPETQGQNAQKTGFLIHCLAMVGIYLHRLLYQIIRNWIRKKTTGTVFFDSVLFSVLLVSYPVYLMSLWLLLYLLKVPLPIIIVFVFLHPITAWVAVRVSTRGCKTKTQGVTLSS